MIGLSFHTHWCSNCQMTKPKEGGQYKESGKIRRWMCASCWAKKNPSGFTKKALKRAA